MALQQVNKGVWRDLKRAAEVRRYRMSVDGGVRGTGVAFWETATWKDPSSTPFLVMSVIPHSGHKWISAAREIMDSINSVMVGLKHPTLLDALYIEMPQYFGSGNYRGEMVAARGDLQKLAVMTGMLMSLAWINEAKIRPYEVNQWKGQLNKKQTEARIKRILPELNSLVADDHSWDAIGIGLYARGQFE